MGIEFPLESRILDAGERIAEEFSRKVRSFFIIRNIVDYQSQHEGISHSTLIWFFIEAVKGDKK